MTKICVGQIWRDTYYDTPDGKCPRTIRLLEQEGDGRWLAEVVTDTSGRPPKATARKSRLQEKTLLSGYELQAEAAPLPLTQEGRMSIILEHWTSPAEFAAARSAILADCRLAEAGCVSVGNVDGEHVDAPNTRCSASVLVAVSVKPHVDNHHPEWSALWILQCGDGHALYVADHKPRDPNARLRKPRKASTSRLPLATGQVVLFNVHRTHWLEAGPCGMPFVGANFDFDERPSRDLVNAEIRRVALAFAPKPLPSPLSTGR